jgi:arylformamidase
MIIHDISLTISEALVTWPDGPTVQMRHVSHLDRGDTSTVTRLNMSAHTGTHVDAPRHFVLDGQGVDQLNLNVLIGPALVIDAPEGEHLSAAVFERLEIPSGTERLLICSRNSDLWVRGESAFVTDFVGITADGARWLVDRGVRLVGVDYLSVASWSDLEGPHQVLLGAEVIILEGLNLSQIAPGLYQLVCLPLKIADCDGAPARAVLIEEEGAAFS